MVIEITTQSQLRDFFEVRESEIHSTQMEGRNFKNYGAEQQRLQISELHFDNLPYSTNVFALGKKKIQDWGVLLSKFPWGRYALNKEVEVVNSVYDLKTSCSIQRFTPFLDSESLTQGLYRSWTRSSIILISREVSVWMIKRHRKQSDSCAEERSLTWSTITSGSLTSLTPYSIIPTYLRLFFGMTTCRIKYEMGWNFIVNGASLYKLRIRGSEKLKIVLELYNLEIPQKKTKSDYHRLKTMVKKELSNFWGHETARLEMGRLSQTSWTRIKGDNVVFTKDKENVHNGRSATGVRKETTFSFRHDDDKRAKSTSPLAPNPEHSTPQDVTNLVRNTSPGGRSRKFSHQPSKYHLKEYESIF